MNALWPILTLLLYLLCAGSALALAGWMLSQRKDRGLAVQAEAAALILTAGWALSFIGLGSSETATAVVLSFANIAWFWALYRFFAHDGRDGIGAIRSVLIVLAFVEILQVVLQALQLPYSQSASAGLNFLTFEATLRALASIGGLVLVHNLYAGASNAAREPLRWPAAGLTVLWLYDLNTATVTYLSGTYPETLLTLRGIPVIAATALLAIGLLRDGANLRFGPSRYVAFRSFSLLVIGAYLLVMVLVAQALAYAGGEFARLMQLGFIALAAAAALLVMPSSRLRGWLRVVLSKHLFQHRYDYRAEWLRFTDTMGRAGPGAMPLRERIVQAAADVTDSPSGLLLVPREDGGLALDTRWQWSQVEVPTEALSNAGVRFFETSRFIVDLDDLRAGRVEAVPAVAHPSWLMDELSAWAMVPLVHYERLVGVVVLARPPITRRLDWEDFDLLGVVGRQLASYLAEQASQDALGEALRFDEFNRRIAFVMHDIKNLASQLSLLARNAERHADKPEFRADMLITLRNSADKLQGLLARLGRYGAQGNEALQTVAMEEMLARLVERYRGQHEVAIVDFMPCAVRVDREGLEQALVHLVQNAIEASDELSPVLLRQRCEEGRAVLEIIDSGSGMTAEFVRTRLFKPFHSSKPGGFGIGAFEARELIRGMGGQLDVESREGLGTRFRIALPLAGTVEQLRSSKASKPINTEVA
ncbi:MAG: PEP-CTERM system histidine kinase PrsK [Porphyrobacter sp.]|nr:PEP-CTERM system histidine kinase PrsK [Porphyrobacter sp.]